MYPFPSGGGNSIDRCLIEAFLCTKFDPTKRCVPFSAFYREEGGSVKHCG